MKDFLLRRSQIFYFALAGGLSAAVEIVFFKIFSLQIPKIIPGEVSFHGIHFPLSNILSTGIAIIFNYWLSILFVFERGKHSKKREFAYFILISIGSTILSLTLFQLFYRYIFQKNFDMGVFVFSTEVMSKISAIATASALNYSLKKRVIFNG